MHGTRVNLAREEGWFPGAAVSVLHGTIEDSLIDGHGRSWCVVRLDHGLDVQERGHTTPSGLRLVRYDKLLISPRHEGVSLFEQAAVSTYLCLLPDEVDPAMHVRSIQHPDSWASCTVCT